VILAGFDKFGINYGYYSSQFTIGKYVEVEINRLVFRKNYGISRKGLE